MPLTLMLSRLEEFTMVLRREVWRQQSDRREVHRSIAEQLEDDGILSSGPSRLNAAIGGMLGEMEHLQTIGEHGGATLSEVETTLVEDGEVGDEGRRRFPLPLGKEFDLHEELLVGEPTGEGQQVGVHGPGITRRFRSP
ncbi:MAG TPA: hypothetical protein VFT63_08195 [bacterium]|nr:hypothetical protein [bacterium]